MQALFWLGSASIGVAMSYDMFPYDKHTTDNQASQTTLEQRLIHGMDGKSNFIKLEDLQPLADQHLEFMQARHELEPLTMFAKHSSVIYRRLKTDSLEATKAAVNLARTERLHVLIDMFNNSNVVDFMLIKWPAWWANDKIERRKERKLMIC
jgi:hypothetical protein